MFNLENTTEDDQRQGLLLFLEAANQGDAAAQFLAGECLILGKGTPKDQSRGVHYLEKAVELKENRAMDLLGVCYVRGWGVEIDEAKAVRLFQAAVDHDNIPAHYNLGARYAQGQGVARNPGIAADQFQIGAERGNAHCMFVYARCLNAGFGRKESFRKALLWFKKSALAGNPDAIKWCLNENIDFREDSQ